MIGFVGDGFGSNETTNHLTLFDLASCDVMFASQLCGSKLERASLIRGWMLVALSGSPNRLNAVLSLLHPLDRYGTPSAIGSAIGRALSRIRTQVGFLNGLVLNHLGSSTARLWCCSVQYPFKTSAKHKRDRGRDSQMRPRPRLNSQPQGATKWLPTFNVAWHDT